MKRKLRHTLFWKLSVIQFSTLFLLAVVAVYLFDYLFKLAIDRTEQILNWDLANGLSAEIMPVLASNLSNWDLQLTFDRITQLNPKVNLYILDQSGNIIASSGGDTELELVSLPLSKINNFLYSTSINDIPIYGPDPANKSRESVFSAAMMQVNTKTFFLYVVLLNDSHRRILTVSQVYSLFTGGPSSVAICIVTAALAGWALFYLLTRRLSHISTIVNEFKHGNFSRRIIFKKTNDEITSLAETVNSMADAIVSNIEELKRKDALRRELIANVSHDLKSPATRIIGLSEMMLVEDSSLSEKSRERCAGINYNCESLNKLLNELFELAKLEAKELVPDMEEFSILELVEELHASYKDVAENADIAIILDAKEELPFVLGDIAMIGRVLSNLLDNALRYTPAGGQITISLQKGLKALISISDTGIGISSADLPHVFERYYQVQQQSGRENGLSGLGLAIVRKIISAHGSEITVTSTEDKGTTFSFELQFAITGQN